MKKSILTIASLLTLTLGLAACGGTPASSSAAAASSTAASSEAVVSSAAASSSEAVASSSSVAATLTIDNKAALTAEWHALEADRSLSLTCSETLNPGAALADGSLVVKSSNTAVIAVTGKILKAVGAGTATVSVAYHGGSDTVDITVADKVAAPAFIYTTVNDIVTNTADDKGGAAAYVVNAPLSGKDTFNAKGTSNKLKNSVTSKDVYLYGATTQASSINWDYANKKYTFINPSDWLSNWDTFSVAKNTTVDALLLKTFYGTTVELQGIIFAMGGMPVANSTVTTDGLVAAEASDMFTYEVTGYIDSWNNASATAHADGSFYLKTAGSSKKILISGATGTAASMKYDAAAHTINYTNPADWQTNTATAKVGVGSTVTLKVQKSVADGKYYAIYEPTYAAPAAVDTTVTKLLDTTDTSNVNLKQLYKVTGYVQGWVSGNYSAADGYFYIGEKALGEGETIDTTKCVEAYGVSAYPSSMTWAARGGRYLFVNPGDFNTSVYTAGVKVGSKVTFLAFRDTFKTTIELMGLVTAVDDTTFNL
jgi:hypothetical protein